jgi:hypothetical protein
LTLNVIVAREREREIRYTPGVGHQTW